MVSTQFITLLEYTYVAQKGLGKFTFRVLVLTVSWSVAEWGGKDDIMRKSSELCTSVKWVSKCLYGHKKKNKQTNKKNKETLFYWWMYLPSRVSWSGHFFKHLFLSSDKITHLKKQKKISLKIWHFGRKILENYFQLFSKLSLKFSWLWPKMVDFT